ncbi:MAG: hypothetical protein ACOCQD_03275 [archaeon]
MTLYKMIMETSRQYKFIPYFEQGSDKSIEIKEYRELNPVLKLFYGIFTNFNIEKKRHFSEQIIYEVETVLKEIKTKEEISYLSYSLNNLIYDLSWFPSVKVFDILKWERDELYTIFNQVNKLIDLTEQDVTESPLKGLMNLTFSNWILKSRNSYNENELYKCMPDTAAKNSVDCNEVWMRERSNLNDSREGQVIKEIFSDQEWIKYSWVKNITLTSKRKTYVNSFVKNTPNQNMLDIYGKNVFGFKTDAISSLLAPICYDPEQGLKFGGVMYYDVIYSQQEFKHEINFLSDIINIFSIEAKEKKKFMEDIIEYWMYSIKDNKWKNERERRYEILFFEDLTYPEVRLENNFFKLRSTLFNFPDFINVNNIIRTKIKDEKFYKVKEISTKPFIFCNDCLYTDYDNPQWEKNNTNCNNCGSSNIIKIEDQFKIH